LSTKLRVYDDLFNWKIPAVMVVRSLYSIPDCTQPLLEIKLQQTSTQQICYLAPTL